MSDLHHSPENGSERPRISWFERVCAFGVQLIAAGAMIAVVNLVALPLSTTAAQASVAGAMDSYFDDMGAAANVTGPTAFDGQRAGYYSLGNVWTRFPQRTTNLANLQLPSARAGCGGIDLFAGSFSFVNSAEIIALLKSVANNAVGFAFKLAIDTVCPECSKIMEEMRQAAQLMNNANINSCETAQALVGGLWPKSDMADRSICESIGSSTGVFTDWAASKHGCGNKGERTSTLAGVAGDPEWADVNTGVPRNYTWHVLKKSAILRALRHPRSRAGPICHDDGRDDHLCARHGQCALAPSTRSRATPRRPWSPPCSMAPLPARLSRIWQCDPGEVDDACLNPTLVTLSVPVSSALRTRVALLLDQMVQATIDDTAVPAPAVELLQVASLPLYKILTVQAAYSRGIASDDRATLAEITSVDLLFAILDQLTSELGKSKSAFIGADQDRIAQWQAQLANARRTLLDRQSNTQVRVSAIMQIIQRTGYIESVLQSSMSPSMSASFDWSRAIAGRGLN